MFSLTDEQIAYGLRQLSDVNAVTPDELGLAKMALDTLCELGFAVRIEVDGHGQAQNPPRYRLTWKGNRWLSKHG